MVTREEFEVALKVIAAYKEQVEADIKRIKMSVYVDGYKSITTDKGTKISDINISVRLWNILSRNYERLGITKESYYDITISDLSNISEKELRKIQGFGLGSLKELKTLCYYADVKLLP